MPTIKLTDKAESDLDSIHEYHATYLLPGPAAGVVLEVLKSLDILVSFPGSGRQSPVPDVRELVLTKYPYLASYRVIGDEIQILRILHHRSERIEAW